MRRRLVVPGVLVFLLVLVPLGWSAAATVSGSAVVTAKGGNGYTLTITNTGTEPIVCMQFFPTGAAIDGAAGPAGASSTFLNAKGFGFRGFSIAPGGSATFTFSTTGAYPPNGGGEVHISADCVKDVTFSATGPAPAAPPTGPTTTTTASPASPQGDCKCVGIDLRAVPVNFSSETTFAFDLRYTIRCTGAATGTCLGQVVYRIAQKPRNDLYFGAGKEQVVGKSLRCAGRCGRAATTGRLRVTGHAAKSLRVKARAGKTFRFDLTASCLNRPSKIVANTHISVVYDKTGRFDPRASDLNGDGTRDG